MKGRFHQLVLLGLTLIALPVLAQAGPPGGNTPGGMKSVTVNGVQLDARTIQSLEAASGTPMPSGNFWYDPLSGLWGVWGGPASGQVTPGLQLGGPLPFDASGGKTNVIINGRAIHPLEYQYLVATYGQAIPGRYWLDAAGNIGVEGGPPLFNLHAAGQGGGGQGSFYSGPGGTISSDGRCTAINPAGGEGVLTGDCQ